MDFQRTMNKIIFDKYLDEEYEDENYPKLRLPPKEKPKEVRYIGWMELEANKGVMEKWMFKYDEPFIRKPLTFHELLKNFGFSTLYVS
jgi:dynein heavy chain